MDDGFLRVTFDRAVDPEGREIGRAVVHHPGSAVIMPVNEKGQVLLERIFRLPVGDYVWELPAGRIDPGETPAKAARRELLEETGIVARSWSKIASFYASPGFLAEKMTIYLAQDLSQQPITRGDDEPMQLRWFTRAELERSIKTGRICDAKTIIGIRTYFQEKPREKQKAKPKPRHGGSR